MLTVDLNDSYSLMYKYEGNIILILENSNPKYGNIHIDLYNCLIIFKRHIFNFHEKQQPLQKDTVK